MGKVQIVTDSNAYLAPETRKRFDIAVIPHRLRVGRSYFEETADFSADDMFHSLSKAQMGRDQLPQLHAADINDILSAYQMLGQKAEEIVSIHMSSELSDMWQQARRAAEMLKGRYVIRVIDSLSTSFGLGVLVEQAARAADEGASVNEIARIVNGAVPHLYLAVFSESLNYLERSAGLGASQSVLGTMLGIKAMLMMEDGRISPLEKVQTRDEVVEKLRDFVVEFASVERVGMFCHTYEQTSASLVEHLKDSLPSVTVEPVTYPASLAAYIGPNMLGVMVYEGTY